MQVVEPTKGSEGPPIIPPPEALRTPDESRDAVPPPAFQAAGSAPGLRPPERASGFSGAAQRIAGRLVQATADLTWKGFQAINRRVEPNSFQPRWAPAPLLKSHERTYPQLGFPRETDSLCPRCVQEVRGQILRGEADWQVLVEGKPGEIRAQIVEREGQAFRHWGI